MGNDKIDILLTAYRKGFAASNHIDLYGLEVSFYDVSAQTIHVYGMSNDKYDRLTASAYKTDLPSILLATGGSDGITTRISPIKCANPTPDDDNYKYVVYRLPDEEFKKHDAPTKLSEAIKEWSKYYSNHFCGTFFYGAFELSDDFRVAVFGICGTLTETFKKIHLHRKIGEFLSQQGNAIAFERTRQATNEALRDATRAAISQVMARNLSHNIGSHVLSKFKSEAAINGVPESITKEEHSKDSFQYKGPIPGIPQSRSQQIAYFNDYLKSRMDYLADVTIATPLLESTFKFCSGLLEGFLTNTVLLNRISGISEGPGYKFQVRGFKVNSGNELVGWPEYPAEESDKLYQYDDYSVAMPNDVLGCHAFYIILENVIRNTYKHSGGSQNIEFHLNIGPYLIPTPEDAEKTYEPSPDLLMVELYDNNCKSKVDIDSIVGSRNKDFNREVLENGKIRPGGLGTIEMEVCAAYLRKIPLDDYTNALYEIRDKHDYNEDGSTNKLVPNIIRAFPRRWSDDSYSLGYRFFLLKPKELLIVADGLQQGADWESAGIRVIERTSLVNETFGHKIIILVSEDQDANVQEVIPLTETQRLSLFRHTPRIIRLSMDKLNEFVGQQSNEVLQKAWALYGNHLIASRGAFLINGKNHAYQFPEIGNYAITEVSFGNHYGGSKENEYITASHHVYDKIDTIANIRNRIEIAEMAATKVCIIDERIQDFTTKEHYSGNIIIGNQPWTYKVNFRQYFERVGVFIPPMQVAEAKAAGIQSPDTNSAEKNLKAVGNSRQESITIFAGAYWPEGNTIEDSDVVNLNLANFGKIDEAGSVQQRLRAYLKRRKDCDFIIIHLGILEKMVTEKGAKTIEDQLRELLCHDESLYSKVIITSGRGTPDNVPVGCRYLPLSAVQHCVETTFDKYLLVQALFNARLPK